MLSGGHRIRAKGWLDGWMAGVDDCGNRALSANDDTSEMIWGTDIKRVRVQRALRNGERGEGIAPLGFVRIERESERGGRKEKKMLLC